MSISKATACIKRQSFVRHCLLALAISGALLFSACSGKDVEELRSSAIEVFKSGDYAAAEQLFDEALSADYGRVSEVQLDILRYRAECELRQGKYGEAADTYEALLNADEIADNKEIYQELLSELGSLDSLSGISASIAEGSYQEAYDAAAELAALDGSLTGKLAWFNKAVSAEYLGNYEEAYELFNEYLKVYPDDAEAKKEADFLRTR